MKRLKYILFLLGLLLMKAAFGQKPAVVVNDEPGWHKIGEITASFDMDTESIVVLGADNFEAIKLKVTDAPINIERVQVLYESDAVEDIDVENELQAGAETQRLDLQHRDRDIEKVSFTYKTSANYAGEKAQVELYGLKAGASEDVGKDNTPADGKDTGEKLKDGVNRSAAVIEAEIKDKVFAGKMGPGGENIYIDEHSKYYYIDQGGSKVYITKEEMRDKPEVDDH